MAGHALSERHSGAVLALLPLLVRIVARRRQPIGLGIGRAGVGAIAGAVAGAVATSVDKRQARKTTAVYGGTKDETNDQESKSSVGKQTQKRRRRRRWWNVMRREKKLW
jgi:hypothetical protein